MSRRDLAAIVLLLLALLAIGLAWPAPHAAGDVPAVFGPVPSSEFSPVRTAGPRGEGTLPSPAVRQFRTPSPAASAPATVAPSAKAVPRLSPVRLRAAVSPTVSKAGVPESVTGIASWYAYVPGGAAAGPALRTALGSGWRGKSVAVCRTDGGAMACVRVTLSDFMRADRLIDLDSRSFAALMPLSRGLVSVEVVP